jgi:hypothetical protein
LPSREIAAPAIAAAIVEPASKAFAADFRGQADQKNWATNQYICAVWEKLQ